MNKFNMGDVFGPGSRVVSTEDSGVCLDFVVYSFSFSIGLWVIVTLDSGGGKRRLLRH